MGWSTALLFLPFAVGLWSSRGTLDRAIKMLQITRYKREGINAGGIETDLFTDKPNSCCGGNLSSL